MGTLSDKLTYLLETKELIRQAIENKGVSVGLGLPFRNYADKINDISGGSGPSTAGTLTEENVIFSDYDGTVLYAYTSEQFLELSELPPLPSHDGLICQGWNHSIQEAQEYVQKYSALVIGASYITDDGKTRLKITIFDELSKDIELCYTQTVTNGVTVDWGDGSAAETAEGTSRKTLTHTYNNLGDYVITLTPADGCVLGFGGGSSTYSIMGSATDSTTARIKTSKLCHVFIGRNVTTIGSYAFKECAVQTITIPNSVTKIEANSFQNCYLLKAAIIPDGVTNVGNSAFNCCYCLAFISIPQSATVLGTYLIYYSKLIKILTLPQGLKEVAQYLAHGCSCLKNLVIPDSVTTIASQSFTANYALKSVNIPESVTSIGTYVFQNCTAMTKCVFPKNLSTIPDYALTTCYSLGSVTFPDNVTKIGAQAFNNCYSLLSLDIPSTVTTISTYAFSNCTNLRTITLPPGITSLSNYLFANDYSLVSVRIPAGVTSVGTYVFQNCKALKLIDFREATQVPSLSNVNSITTTSSTCKIVVPDNLYDDWIATTNWSTSTVAAKIVKESEYTE